MTTPARTLSRLLVASLLLGVAACASTPDSAAQGVEGCYFFEPGQAVDTFRLPEGVRLTDRPLEGWPAIMERGDVKVAVTLRRTGTADYPFGYWLEEGGDSLEIGYPAGGGLVLDVAVRGATLDGTARAVGDTRRFDREPGTMELGVRLERGACPN